MKFRKGDRVTILKPSWLLGKIGTVIGSAEPDQVRVDLDEGAQNLYFYPRSLRLNVIESLADLA